MSTLSDRSVPTALELRTRREPSLIAGIAAAWAFGACVAGLSVAVALGIGVAPAGGAWSLVMLLVAAAAMSPGAWLARRRRIARGPARLLVRADGLELHCPALFRRPLVASWDRMEGAALDRRVARWKRAEGLASLSSRPNVALLFDPPLPAPQLRRHEPGTPADHERLEGLLLAVRHARRAKEVLGRRIELERLAASELVPLVPLGQAGPSEREAAFAVRQTVRWGWASVAGAALSPLLAVAALFCAAAVVADRPRTALGIACGAVAAAAAGYALGLPLSRSFVPF
jgi:hypothetical protein